MARKKTYKNPNVTDAERDRTIKRRVLEERGNAEDIWRHTEPKNIKQKVVDYVKHKTIDEHITNRIMKGVIFGHRYGSKYYPQTPEEKYYDRMGLSRLSGVFRQIRRDDEYRFLSLGTEIFSENPDTGDGDFVICDMTTEQPKNSKRKSDVLRSWEENRRQVQATMEEVTNATVDHALLAEAERKRLEREELERRKRKDGGNEGEDEEEK